MFWHLHITVVLTPTQCFGQLQSPKDLILLEDDQEAPLLGICLSLSDLCSHFLQSRDRSICDRHKFAFPMLFSSVSYGQLARLVTLILFGMNFHALQCHAFKPMTVSNARVRQVDTTLSAWSLPSASDFQSFTSMKSTWYDECNPTARRTVYNE